MSEIQEVFNVLIFGEGFWITFLMIMSICLIVANRVKFSGIVFAIVLVFLALEYNANLSGSSNKLWGVILCFMGVIFLCGQLIADFKN